MESPVRAVLPDADRARDGAGGARQSAAVARARGARLQDRLLHPLSHLRRRGGRKFSFVVLVRCMKLRFSISLCHRATLSFSK